MHAQRVSRDPAVTAAAGDNAAPVVDIDPRLHAAIQAYLAGDEEALPDHLPVIDLSEAGQTADAWSGERADRRVSG